MEIVYFKAKRRNFGDDLNELLWRAILPEAVLSSDKLTLIGIGSILNEEMVGHLRGSNRKVVVLGTGTSYGRPPEDISGWDVKAVRGPLTAAVIGRPEASVTDGAALLAVSGLVPQPPAVRDKILFMPHHHSLEHSRWDLACAKAGLEYANPQSTVAELLAQFAGARLVVTEAMHGAIVADTLRIPWIPVVASPAIDSFKWLDWTRSMELPFRPIELPATTLTEKLRYSRLAQELRGKHLADFPRSSGATEAEHYRAYLASRFAQPGSAPQPPRFQFAREAFKKWSPLFDGPRIARAAEALAQASLATSYLSDERIFADRLDRLQQGARDLALLA